MNKAKNLALTDTKIYYKDNVVWAQKWANTQMEYNREHRNRPCLYGNIIHNKGEWQSPERGSMDFFSKVWDNLLSILKKKMKLEPYLTTNIKINSR